MKCQVIPVIFVIMMVCFFIFFALFLIEPAREMDLNKCQNLSIQQGHADLYKVYYEYEDYDGKVCVLRWCENVSINDGNFLGKCKTEVWEFD